MGTIRAARTRRYLVLAAVVLALRGQLRTNVNFALRKLDRFEALLVGALLVALRAAWLRVCRFVDEHGFLDPLKGVVVGLLNRVPSVRKKMETELEGMYAHMEEEIHGGVEGVRVEELPPGGMSRAAILELLQARARTDHPRWNTGTHSGTVYMMGDKAGDEIREIQDKAAGLFSRSNPLHFDAYPMLRQMEAEIVAMTLKLVHGGPDGVGCTTYGGTESILLAMKAARDRGLAEFGISEPNIIVSTSAHAAYFKGGQYFKIVIRAVPMLENGEADIAGYRRMIDHNTVALVGSAPTFPQGTIDPIPALGQLALEQDIPLHVDMCLGSYMVPFLESIGCPPHHACDFRVPGVASMSLDTHKYGLTTKGSSVLLYRSKELMKYQYGPVPKWTGGVYVTPTLMGSRTGSGIAAAWATLVHVGRDRYMEFCRELHDAKVKLVDAIPRVAPLRVQGRPDAMVVAIESTDPDVNIYAVGSQMRKIRGWALNTLQSPAGIHIALTLANCRRVDEFIADLKAAVDEIKIHGSKGNTSVALYGITASAPKTLLESMTGGVMDIAFTTRPSRIKVPEANGNGVHKTNGEVKGELNGKKH